MKGCLVSAAWEASEGAMAKTLSEEVRGLPCTVCPVCTEHGPGPMPGRAAVPGPPSPWEYNNVIHFGKFLHLWLINAEPSSTHLPCCLPSAPGMRPSPHGACPPSLLCEGRGPAINGCAAPEGSCCHCCRCRRCSLPSGDMDGAERGRGEARAPGGSSASGSSMLFKVRTSAGPWVRAGREAVASSC